MGLIKDFWANEDGATSIEYALIAVVISISIIVTVKQIPVALEAMFDEVTTPL